MKDNVVFADVLKTFKFSKVFESKQIEPTEALIAELERTIGMTVPEPYRFFLLQNGCIQPQQSPVEVPIANSRDATAVSFFLGFGRPELDDSQFHFDIVSLFKYMLKEAGPGLLPIATSEQDVICMRLEPPWRGEIWEWRYETFADEIHDFYLVAKDFDTFMHTMREMKF